MAVTEEVNAALEAWTSAGGPVTVDLSDVTFIDSAGIGVLLRAAAALGERGCIIVHGARGPVKKVFELTGVGSGTNVHIIPCTVLAAA
jgi:anti-anti-sigma factor